MNKRIFKYYLAFIFFSFFMIPVIFASNDDDGKFGKSRISKRDKFTNKTKIRNDRLTKKKDDFNKPGIPDPGDGGDGFPVPIADGFEFIIIGGIIYVMLKRRKKKQH